MPAKSTRLPARSALTEISELGGAAGADGAATVASRATTWNSSAIPATGSILDPPSLRIGDLAGPYNSGARRVVCRPVQRTACGPELRRLHVVFD